VRREGAETDRGPVKPHGLARRRARLQHSGLSAHVRKRRANAVPPRGEGGGKKRTGEGAERLKYASHV